MDTDDDLKEFLDQELSILSMRMASLLKHGLMVNADGRWTSDGLAKYYSDGSVDLFENLLVAALEKAAKLKSKEAAVGTVNPYIARAIESIVNAMPRESTKTGKTINDEELAGIRRRLEESRNEIYYHLIRGNPIRKATQLGGPPTIASTVRVNKPSLEMAALAVIACIEERLQRLNESRPNSDEAIKERDDERDELQNLRDRIVDFLKALSDASTPDKPLAKATLSVKDGIKQYWAKNYESIISKTGKLAVAVPSLALLQQFGALNWETTLLVGGIVEGKTFIDAIKTVKGIGCDKTTLPSSKDDPT